MNDVSIVLALLVAIVALGALADRLRLPYPILLVIGGIAIGFVPGLPAVQISPDVVFIVFIPPLVYAAAFNTSWRDFVANARPIASLGIGLVFITAVIVAVVAHSVVGGIPWAPAFVLGAVVSNTDTTAVKAVDEQVGLSRRLTSVLEGESLVNDAVALTAFRVAVTATVAGSFSDWEIGGDLGLAIAVAIPIGLAVGWCSAEARSQLENSRLVIIVGLLTPYAAYLPANQLGGSGILAVVIAGLFVGRREARIENAQTRIQAQSVWDFLVFLLNGLLFILVGLQLGPIWDSLSSHEPGHLIWAGTAVSLTIILARVAWIALTEIVLPLAGAPSLADSPDVGTRGLAVLAWGGLRGGDTLAAALAIPLVTDSGAPFPERSMVMFLAVTVIVVTLVGQGLTLPALIRWLKLPDDTAEREEEVLARRTAAEAAVQRLEVLDNEYGGSDALIERLRQRYVNEVEVLSRLDSSMMNVAHDVAMHQHVQRDVIETMHEALLQLRDDGAISDVVLRRVERDLDLESARFDKGEA